MSQESTLERYTDIAAINSATDAFLVASAAKNNLLLGITTMVIRDGWPSDDRSAIARFSMSIHIASWLSIPWRGSLNLEAKDRQPTSATGQDNEPMARGLVEHVVRVRGRTLRFRTR